MNLEMATTSENRRVFSSLGLASLALGAVGLLLFFMPILGIPIAAIGLLLGLVVLLGTAFGARWGLRWGVLGTALCVIALVVDILAAVAPESVVPDRRQQENWRPPLVHYVSPPAEPGLWGSQDDRSPTGYPLAGQRGE
jgi:hypothetical protein